jgi:serine/threonine-protein kinase RsbW
MKAALTLSNDLAELGILREFAAAFAERSGFPAREAGRLMVVVDELFSNIVRHGYDQSNASGSVEVRLSFVRGRLEIVFTDNGRPFDPLAAPAPDLDLPPERRPVGGLGIHFVRNLVDEARYSIRSGRNRLALTRLIDLSRSSASDRSGRT